MSGWVRGPANFATGIHFGALRGAGNSRWQVPKASADQGSAVGGGGNSARPVSVDLGAWGLSLYFAPYWSFLSLWPTALLLALSHASWLDLTALEQSMLGVSC